VNRESGIWSWSEAGVIVPIIELFGEINKDNTVTVSESDLKPVTCNIKLNTKLHSRLNSESCLVLYTANTTLDLLYLSVSVSIDEE
jgi:hypothetical protein